MTERQPIAFEPTLRRLIVAWESLPRGNYGPRTVERWLNETMGPAINEARAELARSDGEIASAKEK